jgi:mannose-6-phosphate isomerase-like protein (cupin superfamily)
MMDEAHGPRFLVDPYLDWTAAEGLPVVEDFCVDMHKLETKSWARLGDKCRGAFVHLKGRGDFISVFLMDLQPSAATSRQQHLYEEVFYVLEGHGSCTVALAGGQSHTFEFGPKALFSLPLNCPYRLFNSSGRERVLLASTNNFCMMLNVLRKESFIFGNPQRFPEREGGAGYLRGEGTFVPTHRNREMWETNFVADLGSFELRKWNSRGAGSANILFCLADGTMHAHVSEMSVGTYKKGHRHGPDFHVCIVKGQGYSLFWYEDEQEFRRYDWGPGSIFAPVNMIYHQHFCTGREPVRYLATAFGSSRYPFSQEKRAIKMGVDVSVKDGGAQIEYEDQDPRIHQIFLEELKKNGVQCRMSEFMDESILPKG